MSSAKPVICKGCGGAIVPPGPILSMIGFEGQFHVSCATSAAVLSERQACAQKAREFASHYPDGSDGRNTFVILAEWIENRATVPST